MSLRDNTIINTLTDYPSSREEAIRLGVPRYYGYTCPKDGTTLRRVKQQDCSTCHKAHVKAYRKTPAGSSYRKDKRLEYKQRLVTQCPPWADKKAIRKMYLEASRRGLEVDHVVPLKNPLVCGLHVEGNLQLLTPLENGRKRNNFEVE